MISEHKSDQTMDYEYLTFYIGKELVAIKLKYVETIEFVSEIIPIPRAPNHVSGVAKIENSIIPIINLDVLVDNKSTDEGSSPIAVIISIDTAVFGIYISDPPKVSNFDSKILKIDSKYKGKIPSFWIEGQIKQDDKSLIILDPSKFWIGLGESEIIGPSSNTISNESLTSVIPKKEIKSKQKKVDTMKEKNKEEVKDKKKKGKKKEVVENPADKEIKEIDKKKEESSGDKIEEQLNDKKESKSKGTKKKATKKSNDAKDSSKETNIDTQ